MNATDLRNDLRFAVRRLSREPLFTAVVVVLLGLGIGACLVIFSLIESILLRPLSYPDSERLVEITEHDLFNDGVRSHCATANFLDWKARSQGFEDMGFAIAGSGGNLRGGDDGPVRLTEGIVSTNYFDVLGIRPHKGRFFVPEESELGNYWVAVLSHDLWMRWFGGDPAAIGSIMNREGQPYKVVGVLPPDFRYPHPGTSPEPDLWRPLALYYYREDRTDRTLEVVGRLKKGVSLAAAQDELSQISLELAKEFPQTNTNRTAVLRPLKEYVEGDLREPLQILLGAVGLLLLVTCLNVGMLMLSRSEARRHEVAVRAALGAGTGGLLRPFILESILLTLAGTALAWALAPQALRLVLSADSWNLARAEEIGFHPAALIATLLLVLFTATVCGLGPALMTLRHRNIFSSSLRQGGRGASAGFHAARWQKILVTAEVALAILLLFGAGLLARSYLTLVRVDPGFEPEGALVASLQLSWKEYQEPATRVQFYDQLVDRLQGRAEVRAAAAASVLPLRPGRWNEAYEVEGHPVGTGEEPVAELTRVTRGFFEAMGITVIDGRPFGREDRSDSLPVAVVSRALAERWWPGTSAVGQKLRLKQKQGEIPWKTIVGVADDVHQNRLDEVPRPQIYLPSTQAPLWDSQVVIRTEGSPWKVMELLRQTVLDLDSTQIPFDFQTLEEVYSGSLARKRLFLSSLALFASVALILAALGMYSIMAYSIRRREQEFGLRMAMGADRIDIVRLVLSRGLTLFAVGGGLGLVLALSLGWLMERQLFGIGAADPWTLLIVVALMGTVALLSGVLPAQRAAGVEPRDMLQRE